MLTNGIKRRLGGKALQVAGFREYPNHTVGWPELVKLILRPSACRGRPSCHCLRASDEGMGSAIQACSGARRLHRFNLEKRAFPNFSRFHEYWARSGMNAALLEFLESALRAWAQFPEFRIDSPRGPAISSAAFSELSRARGFCWAARFSTLTIEAIPDPARSFL